VCIKLSDIKFVLERGDGLHLVAFDLHDLPDAGLGGQAFQSGDALSCRLGRAGDPLVFLHALPQVLLASRGLDVLDANVDALLDDAVVHALVHLHADRSLGDVPNEAGFAVVEFVGHAFLDGPVRFDVDIFTELVGREIFAETDRTVLSERL